MNQHIHKVIFNKTTGRMDVVSEIVSAQGGATLASANEHPHPAWHHSITQFLIKPVAFALMLSLGTAQILPAQAQVIADPSAPKSQQPTVLPTASGATQINIQTPSAAGVSMNQYKQFDTQTNGTVLNNSRTNTNTQTAGWIQANPWLATGSARVIVNQVNSSNPSRLTGNIEVAGQRADLIIANPSGININGAAIINANRTTFTTGVPQLANGSLTGYQVNQGQINVEGTGLNAMGSDYTDLLARAVKVNAGIWANNLAITTGANSINADNSQFTANTVTGTTPSLAIDTSALGGMYAGKITLIGTENGVGVNNAGQIAASAGNVTISANGMLSNSGTINSNGAENTTQIQSTQLANTGSISSQGNTQIQTAGLTNSGTIAAGREAKLTATELNNSTGTINGQRIDITANSLNNTQGKIQQTGTQALALNAGSISNLNNGLIGYEPLDSGSGTGSTGTGTGSTGTGTTTPPSTATGGGSSTVVQPTPVVLADGQINVQSHLNNDAGRITANGGIDLTASNGLENHATLNLNKLNVTGDTLNNSSGQINSTQTAVSVNTVNNVAGQIQTAGNSHIQANRLDNHTGLIRSDLANKLTASTLNNSNTQGVDQGIEGDTVAIQSSQLTNVSGAIRAKNDLMAQGKGLTNDHIDNSQGLMSSNGTLKLTDNDSNTLAITNTAGQIISEGNSSIQAKGLTGDGTVTSNTDLNIQLVDSFNNAGITSAVGNLTFTTAGNLTNVTALKAGNGATIGAQNIDNKAGAEISSAKTQLTANDTLTNRGLIDGGDTFIQANTVNNVGTGRIYGDHIAIGAGTLNNVDETLNSVNTAATIAARNRLDLGVQNLLNQEHSLIYSDGLMSIGGSLDGNHQAMGSAANIVNTSATIESMGDMQINAQNLLNSNADFTIKRVSVGSPINSMLISPKGDPNKYDISNFTWRNWSRAGLYVWNNNPTAAIGTELGKTPILSVGEQTCSNPADESTCRVVAGAEYPASDPAWNYFGVPTPEAEPPAPNLVEPVRPTLAEPVAVPTTDPNYTQYLIDKAAYDAAMANYNQLQAQYTTAQANYQAAHDAWFADTDNKYAALADKVETYNAQFGGEIKAWTQYQLTQTQQEDQINTSDPALIRSGGNMFLTGGTVTNDKSTIIAGGSMLGTLNAIKNIDGKGEHVTYFDGTSQYTKSRWRGGFKRYHQRDWDSKQPYHDEIHQPIDIPVALALENTASTGSGMNIGDQQTGPSIQIVASGAAVSSVDVNTAMPNNSLYTTNPDDPNYLIQTDPRFTNYRQWLSSDWMLSALNLDPATVHKRLGDGYYEQKLIRDQVAQLTGRRYIGDYQNDEEQYKALMNSGVTFAQSYKLRPGIALTAAQVAQLTSDIVWLETQTVMLPSGISQQVLVPKLYAMIRTGDISNSGALLSGHNVQLKLNSDLDNSGTIAGRNIVNLSANNLNNSGNIVGQQIALQADKDINITGGIVNAQNTLSVVAGNDLNVTTTTQTTNQHDRTFDTQRTSIERVAGLYVSAPAGQMLLAAGKDITLTGADIASGSAIVSAGNHLTLNTMTTGHSESMQADAKNYRKQSNTQEVGTNINTVGNLSLQAQGQLTATAANLNSQTGTLSMYGKDGVTIQNGMASDTFDEGHYHKTSSVLSSKSTETRIHQDSTQAMASNVTGAQVIIQSGKDLNVIGSNVVSDNLTQLTAQNNLNILSAQNTSTQTQFEETKKSGLTGGLSAGVLSVGYSKSKTTATNDNQSTTQAASTIASLDGDTNIIAGNHLQITASDVAAGDDITLVGKDIQLTAAQETNRQDSTYKSKTSGFSVGITVDPAAAFKSAYKSTYDNTPATGTVGKVTRLAEAVGAGAKAATTPVVVTAGSHTSSTENHTATSDARVSTVQAGGDLKMIATDGSITSQGAQISAEGNALLLAKDNINLDVAHNYETQTSDSRASGWGFDNRMTGLPVGMYKSKANGDGTTDTTVSTNLSVGGSATLATTTGDINIIGSNAVSTGDMNLNAANNLNIISAQNTATNENHSRSKAIGNVVISDTERFMGYHNEKANNDNQTVTQVFSNVGSLSGNVNATAGNQYTQIASNLVAGNDINVTAKDIDIRTAQNTGDAHSDQSALKIGAFARVSSPIIDLVNNIEASNNSDGRLQAMQGMAAAGNAYQAGSAIASAAGAGYGSGSLLKAEVGIGVASNQSNDNSTYSTSVGNTVKAGNNVTLTSTERDIHVQQTDMTAGNTIKLDSAKDILLEAGQSTSHTDGKHSNYGVEVGVGVSVGAQTGVYAYVAANAGKGSYNTDTVTNSNTHLTADNIQINSKGDTTLKGATATANSISTDVGGKLAIESLQDTAKQTSSESGVNARVQVSFGTAWEASGGVNASKGNGDFAQVTEQSGLFAGDGGYHVKANAVELTGGAIASTNAANSDLTADKFTHTDIQNHMNYDASSVSLSGSVGGTSSNKDGTNTTDSFKSQDLGGVSKGSLTPSLPMNESGKDSSTTRATLTEGNITIGGQSTTAKDLGVNTDASTANAQIANLPNIQQLLTDQKAMVSAVGTVTSSVTQAVSDKHDYEQSQADAIKAQILADDSARAIYNGLSTEDKQAFLLDNEDYRNAFNSAQHWSTGGDYKRAADVITAIVTGVGSGQAGAQVATNAIAPYAAQLIGNAFDPNKGGENASEAAQILSHAVLGAVLAYANGGNAATGAIAGGGSEAAAQYLVRELYPQAIKSDGTFDASLLDETQRQNILALTNGIGAVVGGLGASVSGGDAVATIGNASVDAYVAQNAVENNTLVREDWSSLVGLIKDCNATRNCNQAQIDQLREKSKQADVRIKSLFEKVKSGQLLTNEEVYYLKWMRESAFDNHEWQINAATNQEYLRDILGDEAMEIFKPEYREMIRAASDADLLHKNQQVFEPIKKAISLAVDFTPIIGDIKGFAEAETTGDYFFAALGVVPGLGDGAQKIYKAKKAYEKAKAAGNVADMKKAMETAGDAYVEAKGGAHKVTSQPKNDGFDSHHCPAQSCYKGAPISSADGPAIKMDPADHQQTASFGNRASARAYRAEQQALLEQGRLMEAIQMDVNDIRSRFGNKYDDAIQQMLDYAKTVDPNQFRLK